MVLHNQHNELLISWLNDAYAMEQSLVPTLQNHAKDARDYPLISNRIQQHVEETRQHAELVKGCLERLGTKPSTAKASLSKMMGSIKEAATAAADDELVKNNLADIATEHFEIACYHSLMAAARDVGDMETVRVCQQILQDEEDMAQFLEQQLPQTTVEVLHEYAATHRS